VFEVGLNDVLWIFSKLIAILWLLGLVKSKG
jgi:hypothetical protein